MKKIYLTLFFIIFGIQILSAQNKLEETLLETCGILSAQGVYITYTSIGTLADAYVYGVYDDEPTYTGENFINTSETNMENIGINIQYDDENNGRKVKRVDGISKGLVGEEVEEHHHSLRNFLRIFCSVSDRIFFRDD